MPALLQHLRRDTFRLQGGLPICSKLYYLMLALVLLLYILSPVDLIPEGIFGIFGLADDLCALLYVALYATGAYRTYITNLEQAR